MSKIKHVLVILLLILPMFVLAPTLVANTNETLASPIKADTALPAAFVEETLRVAVYAESNTSLPTYATGGEYSDNYNDVVSMLVGEGFSVTAISTQMILDHKLLAADYDVFVLPNQLPKDEITYLVKDYWLAGGGILSLDGGIGYCFYMGLVDLAYEGGFELTPPASPGMWGSINDTLVSSLEVNGRHSVTKAYEDGTVFSVPSGNFTILNPEMMTTIGDRFIPIIVGESLPVIVGAAFEEPIHGGKLVQIPGDCSSFTVWQRQVISDAIDWLAPRPKAKVALDFTHSPFYGVDSWDTNASYVPRYRIWRDTVVNHSYTFDKLYSTYGEFLTADDISKFDVLIINMPTANYTASEIAVIRSWVQDGGGLYLIGDSYAGFTAEDQRLNAIVDGLGISINTTTTYPGASVFTDFAPHPLFEGVTSVRLPSGSTIDVSPPAYHLMEDGTGDIVLGGRDFGDGRIVMVGDVNHFDYDYMSEEDNSKLSTNLINWLSSGTANVLVYADHGSDIRDPNRNPATGPVALALNDLGLQYYLTTEVYSFNLSLFSQNWDLVILDNNNYNTITYQPHLMDYVESGGKLIMNTWNMNGGIMDYFGIESFDYLDSSPRTLYVWDETHPIFSLPVNYGADNVSSTLDVYTGLGTYAFNFTTFANASAIAGFSPTADGGAGIILSAEGRAIMNGPLLSLYGEDTDDSTYMDAYELWLNEIGYLYYDRPMVNHPDDVTYVETETGNEISWTPVVDAGPASYIIRENGSIVESGSWSGGPITINVDGVNASLTDYQITVFDKLGYSATDLVVLNVTASVEPTTSGGGGAPLDPTLLLIIGAAAAGVVVILIIVMFVKKKK